MNKMDYLSQDNQDLKKDNQDLKAEVAVQGKKIDQLSQDNQDIRKDNQEMKEMLLQLLHKEDKTRSSISIF